MENVDTFEALEGCEAYMIEAYIAKLGEWRTILTKAPTDLNTTRRRASKWVEKVGAHNVKIAGWDKDENGEWELINVLLMEEVSNAHS